MFAVVIPLAIFVLPALLKRLGCSLLPIEVQDAGLPRVLAEERKKFANEQCQQDDDPKEVQDVIDPSSTSESAVSSEGSMESDRDEEMAEAPEVADKDASFENANESVPTESSENTALESQKANGGTEMAAPAFGRTVSNDSNNARRTNSRVASLRAAFEQADQPVEPARRRFNSEDGINERNAEVSKEHEAEITRLNAELEREKDLRLEYEEKVTSLEEELEELNSQLEEQEEAWHVELESRSQVKNRDAEDRVSALQKQLADLKRDISTSVRPNIQVSDTTFREELGVLQHEIQNWVVNNFRRVKLEATPTKLRERLKSVVESDELETLSSFYDTFDPSARLAIYQATVVHFLLDIFNNPYLFGIPLDSHWMQASQEAAHALESVLVPASYHRWRAMTFDSLRQCEEAKLHTEGAIHGVAVKIMSALDAITEQDPAEAKLTSLKAVTKRAIDLAHLMRVQQAQYNVFLPSPGDDFDANTMDDLSEEHDSDAELTIRCATFFSVVKSGDENGENPDLKNLIMKASVLCND